MRKIMPVFDFSFAFRRDEFYKYLEFTLIPTICFNSGWSKQQSYFCIGIWFFILSLNFKVFIDGDYKITKKEKV